MLKKSKIKPYRTKMGTTHLLDIYAHEITLYLRRDKSNLRANFRNVHEAMRVVEIFYRGSGLKVNRGKTYITIFGSRFGKLVYVDQLGIKWCSSFKLLGITFNQTLSNMECNYDKCLKSMKH